MLYTQCTVLKGRLEIVKRSISNERDKQQVLLDRLEMIRSMLQDGDHTTFHEFKYPPLPSNLSDLTLDSSFEDANATQSDGSPVSLQTKRKAMVIDYDDRALKRLKRLA
ncbi:hypothetical protein EIP86_006917 [Pleurotus ostreatoroseus]|nr:hypothetical protein EIP86_006917 [Pleurotus ostreatoroseus]